MAIVDDFAKAILKGNFGAKMSIFQKKGRTSLLQIFVFSLLYRTN